VAKPSHDAQDNHTALIPPKTNTDRSFMLQGLSKGLVTRGVDWLARGVMRTGSMFLTRRAKLNALSSAIHWAMERQNNQPLYISHDSGFGDLTLMSDGDLIQLTWKINESKNTEATDPDHIQDHIHGNECSKSDTQTKTTKP
jgi:hypothetical protein